MLQIEHDLAIIDAQPPEVRALIHEYGANAGMLAGRQFYGRWGEARKHLEAERRALQVARWENIR
jgi:hypothetical protein